MVELREIRYNNNIIFLEEVGEIFLKNIEKVKVCVLINMGLFYFYVFGSLIVLLFLLEEEEFLFWFFV